LARLLDGPDLAPFVGPVPDGRPLPSSKRSRRSSSAKLPNDNSRAPSRKGSGSLKCESELGHALPFSARVRAGFARRPRRQATARGGARGGIGNSASTAPPFRQQPMLLVCSPSALLALSRLLAARRALSCQPLVPRQRALPHRTVASPVAALQATPTIQPSSLAPAPPVVLATLRGEPGAFAAGDPLAALVLTLLDLGGDGEFEWSVGATGGRLLQAEGVKG
jgi:hypothetical protein